MVYWSNASIIGTIVMIVFCLALCYITYQKNNRVIAELKQKDQEMEEASQEDTKEA